MPYAAQSDLIDAYGEDLLVALTDRAEPPAEAIDTAVVDRALADTDAVVDGYLKGRYALPLASVPPLVKSLALPIALYKLHRTSVADKVAQDYAGALKTLRDIAAGVVRLDVAGIEPAASGSSGVKTNFGDRPRLDGDSLKGFV